MTHIVFTTLDIGNNVESVGLWPSVWDYVPHSALRLFLRRILPSPHSREEWLEEWQNVRDELGFP